jgi:hypothetical protein
MIYFGSTNHFLKKQNGGQNQDEEEFSIAQSIFMKIN